MRPQPAFQTLAAKLSNSHAASFVSHQMKIMFSYACAAMLPLVLIASTIAAEPSEPKLRGPTLAVEDALTIAKDFVARRRIHVADSYIDSAGLKRDPNSNRGAFWLVTWLRNEYASGISIKGGQTYVRIYMDRTAEVFYGE